VLARYLGNKTALLEPILSAIAEVTPAGGRVGDLFAGTMAVSLALKERGYHVVANDINHFSYTIGCAYLVRSTIPTVDLNLIPRRYRDKAIHSAETRVHALTGTPGYFFLDSPKAASRFKALAALLCFLETSPATVVPRQSRRSDFFDTYTSAGEHSQYVSSRGSAGKRRFFTPENGKRIDIALCLLRHWYRSKAISSHALAICSSVLCRGIEQVANTQGTWHDFPREWIDPRAHLTLKLMPPAMDAALAGGHHVVGKPQDSLEFAKTCPDLDTLYLDPPYNFRQYTAYYFLPNVVTLYPRIRQLDRFFADVQFVRGQNMTTDFDSIFCRKHEFLHGLDDLISRTPTRHVVLSYFNGRNHWNDFKESPNDIGRRKLEKFFRTRSFVPRSLNVIRIERTNYQSYKGYKALGVNEYLFVARKSA
jgi:adenine-specific DNA-methyltransferase